MKKYFDELTSAMNWLAEKDNSIFIGQDNIIKAMSIFYDDEQLYSCMIQTIIDSVKSKYNLTDEQYSSIQKELESINKN